MKTIISFLKKILFTIVLIYLVTSAVTLRAQGWQWSVGSLNTGPVTSSSIAVDMHGNVYESGNASGPLTSTYGPFVISERGILGQGILVSTDSRGNYRWALGTQDADVTFYSIATDPYDNIYVLGNSYGLFTFGACTGSPYETFCAKINSSGVVQWIKPISNYLVSIGDEGIKTDNTGNFYIAGSFGGEVIIGGSKLISKGTKGRDVFYALFDPSCSLIWAKSFGGTGDDLCTGMTVASNNEFFLTGIYNSDTLSIGTDNLSGGLFFVAKFGHEGTPVWARTNEHDTLAWSYFSGNNVNSIATDDKGSAYITGTFIGNTFFFGNDTLLDTNAFHKPTIFLAKYDSSGNEKWARTLPGCYAEYGLAADACGNIWVSGQYGLAGSMFLAEYDSLGHLEDTLFTNVYVDNESGLAIDNQGNLYVRGDYMTPWWPSLFVLKYK